MIARNLIISFLALAVISVAPVAAQAAEQAKSTAPHPPCKKPDHPVKEPLNCNHSK